MAADVGWCALDRNRRPLTGLELRGCWTGRAAGTASSKATPPLSAPVAGELLPDLPVRGFVPVESLRATPTPAPLPPGPLEIPLAAVEPTEAWDARVSLFGDLER